MEAKELWVDRSDYRSTKIVEGAVPDIADGDVLVRTDFFALTANNVSYALSGDMIGYWKFFPAEAGWGKVPVWGFGEVVRSRHPDVPEGERLYGYWPMATHVVLTPGHVTPRRVMDTAAHRADLPPVYNTYSRTSAEPDGLNRIERERALFFPLFITSYLLADYLKDNNLFGARQILVGSVSSKTGFGMADLLKSDPDVKADVIGLTSPGNADFVRGIDVCDRIVTYGSEGEIDPSIPSVFVDMSGDGELRAKLHSHLQDTLAASIQVGATHWEATGAEADLPGPKPEFFFAPSQIEKREQDWGPGVVMDRANTASAALAAKVAPLMAMEQIRSVEVLEEVWRDLLDNKVAPNRGLVVSL